ncbi:DUF3558 domain-containing protein [Saccharomonospora sp. NPDC046836]|uniref:DUF3558 domain-containing protein n=1 Tax=Saccharomonospora sp. NPDC046836 TaxID=3156921 RepID=UPI0033E07DB8
MSLRPRAVLALAALSAATLTACGTDTEAGQAAPASSASSASTGAPSSSAEQAGPSVTNPLDATALVTAPCDALSATDLDRLGLGEGRERSTSGGVDATACSWQYATESGNRIDLSVVTENANGLSAIYEQRETNDYFEETEIGGYPAVYTSTLDNRSDGGCGLWVGLNDEVTLLVLTNLNYGPEVSDPCPVADQVAQATIATLGG